MQEVLGSAHNLFGSVHVAHVRSTGNGAFAIEHVLPGQTAGEVLGGICHETERLVGELVTQATSAVVAGKLSLVEADLLIANYQHCLTSYTYLSR